MNQSAISELSSTQTSLIHVKVEHDQRKSFANCGVLEDPNDHFQPGAFSSGRQRAVRHRTDRVLQLSATVVDLDTVLAHRQVQVAEPHAELLLIGHWKTPKARI